MHSHRGSTRKCCFVDWSLEEPRRSNRGTRTVAVSSAPNGWPGSHMLAQIGLVVREGLTSYGRRFPCISLVGALSDGGKDNDKALLGRAPGGGTRGVNIGSSLSARPSEVHIAVTAFWRAGVLSNLGIGTFEYIHCAGRIGRRSAEAVGLAQIGHLTSDVRPDPIPLQATSAWDFEDACPRASGRPRGSKGRHARLARLLSLSGRYGSLPNCSGVG